MLLVAVVGAFLLQLAGLYLPLLQTLLLVIVSLSCLGYVAVRLDRILHPAVRQQRR